MSVKPVTFGPFTKGVDASAGVLSQPKGSVSRASNFILTKRGSLHTCDGSGGLFYFNGAPTLGRGKMLVLFLYQSIGVSNYYLALAQALDLPIGPPQNLISALASGGALISGTTYYYKVTALDGVGGETTASNETSATPSGGNLSVALTWNFVPNAASYNVYRATSPGGEGLLIGTGLPVPQVGQNTATVTYTDNGTASGGAFAIATAQSNNPNGPPPTLGVIQWTASAPVVLSPGHKLTASGMTPSSFNGNFAVFTVIDSTHFSTLIGSAPRSTTATGGSMTPGAPPLTDTTQQIVLFKMPLIIGNPAQIPVFYNNSNIVALFPALLTTFSTAGGGGGGSGGGGGTGGGGSSGGGTGGGGRPII